jgi:aspartate aminotransferase
MSSDAMLDHEYLPIDGLKLFNEKASRLVLGDDSEAITQNRVSKQFTFH